MDSKRVHVPSLFITLLGIVCSIYGYYMLFYQNIDFGDWYIVYCILWGIVCINTFFMILGNIALWKGYAATQQSGIPIPGSPQDLEAKYLNKPLPPQIPQQR